MTFEHAFMVAMAAMQLGMFVIASFIVPSMRAMNVSVTNVTNELHAVKVQLATMETRLSGIDAVRMNVHSVRDEIHSIKLRMAIAGLYEGHPGESLSAHQQSQNKPV